jgi:formylglycine-generating enzyme required for sulfatase activity
VLSKNARRFIANAIAGRLSVLLVKLQLRPLAVTFAALCAALPACRSRDEARDAPVAASGSPSAAPGAAPGASSSTQPLATASPLAQPSLRCAPGQQLIPGGKVWLGSDPKEHFSDDESPRFRTELAPYCLDETEVTVAAYRACVDKGACTKPNNKQFHCNDRYQDRVQHPINCVTWKQADQFCAARGQRLPTEAEWEFAARGGEKYLEYSWGNESPDGRTCWKQPHSCAVKSFAPGAFGLFDMTGNVWEWVSDYYGPYPWPPQSGFSRVYRGGSWSRRFEKWLHTRLRNRESESFSGSHLGLRCASSPDGVKCPFGASADGRCLAGVLERACEAPRTWNGARCAKPGEPKCREGWQEVAGHGCVLSEEEAPPDVDLEAEKAGVVRVPAPQFETDCARNFHGRPHAFTYSGGTHRGRNLVSRSAGCKNRDVGVGFNSTCCP